MYGQTYGIPKFGLMTPDGEDRNLAEYMVEMLRKKDVMSLVSPPSEQVETEQQLTVRPGNWVFIKVIKRNTWNSPKWEWPYQMVLTTPTAVRISERPRWTHLSNCKKVNLSTCEKVTVPQVPRCSSGGSGYKVECLHWGHPSQTRKEVNDTLRALEVNLWASKHKTQSNSIHNGNSTTTPNDTPSSTGTIVSVLCNSTTLPTNDSCHTLHYLLPPMALLRPPYFVPYAANYSCFTRFTSAGKDVGNQLSTWWQIPHPIRLHGFRTTRRPELTYGGTAEVRGWDPSSLADGAEPVLWCNW